MGVCIQPKQTAIMRVVSLWAGPETGEISTWSGNWQALTRANTHACEHNNVTFGVRQGCSNHNH